MIFAHLERIGIMNKQLQKKIGKAAAQAQKFGDQFRILSMDCKHWDRKFEWQDALCSHKKNIKRSCNPITCPWKEEFDGSK